MVIRDAHSGWQAESCPAAVVILGLAAPDEPRGHVLLGSEALSLVKPALLTALDKIDIWEKVSRSTDFKRS
jgi:hypothetical protein